MTTVNNADAAREEMTKALRWLGINLKDQNFQDTPARWIKFIQAFCEPYDPAVHLTIGFEPKLAATQEYTRYGQAMVVQHNIPYQAVCAHHLVPVLGRAAVGYIPTDRVVGLSKLTRLVWGLSHASPSLQEDVTNEVVDALMEHLKALGAICVIRAEHGCMACRGVSQQEVITTTSAIRGVFIDEPHARDEFYHQIRN